MRALRTLGAVAGVGLAALVADLTVVTPRRLRVHDVSLAVPGWPAELDGLRVAVVGDVHAGSPWFGLDRIRSIVKRVADARGTGWHYAPLHHFLNAERAARPTAPTGDSMTPPATRVPLPVV